MSDHPLPDSRLYTFVDEPREFALYFLEGQKLIEDLALLNTIPGPGFAWFRDVVLSVQPTIAYLKRGEQLGFYMDSADPLFRLKIETAHHGDTRCALFPADLGEFPRAMTGLVRVQKLFPNNRPPYESVVAADDLPLRDVVNRVLATSYQVHSVVAVSDVSDQSVMLHRLPELPGKDASEYSEAAVEARHGGIARDLEATLSLGLVRPEEILEAFGGLGFHPVADRPVRFRCSCSRERAVHNVRLVVLGEGGLEALFDPGQETLELVCEYCKRKYSVGRDDLRRPPEPPH